MCQKSSFDSSKSDFFIIYIIAIIWQLMRAYVLSILEKISGQGHPITEEGIIEWANQKVSIYLAMKQREFLTN